MKKCHALPGILKIWTVSRSSLPNDVVYRAVAGIPIQVQFNLTSITMKGPAFCEVEQTFDNNSYIEQTRLTFSTLDEVDLDKHPAFVIQTMDGNRYIIGSKERPYPTVKITNSTGQLDGEPAVRKYEVSFNAKKALAICFT